MTKIKMSLADNYCEKCIHFEICQMTGCQDRKDLEKLLKLSTPIKPIYSEYEQLDEEEYRVIPTNAKCPNCRNEFKFGTWNDEENHHCICGQRIDWE